MNSEGSFVQLPEVWDMEVQMLPTTIHPEPLPLLAGPCSATYDGRTLSYDGKKLPYENRRVVRHLEVLPGVTSLQGATCDRYGEVLTVGLFAGCDLLRTVSLPSSLTSLGAAVFEKCSSLSSIVLPEGLATIGEFAFHGCTSLVSVVLPDSLRAIGDGCFNRCRSLSAISLPSSLTTLGPGAFFGCESLASVKVPTSLRVLDENVFERCSILTSVHLPLGLLSIGDGCFQDCPSLQHLLLPSSVSFVSRGAFHGCSMLEDRASALGVSVERCLRDEHRKDCGVRERVAVLICIERLRVLEALGTDEEKEGRRTIRIMLAREEVYAAAHHDSAAVRHALKGVLAFDCVTANELWRNIIEYLGGLN